MHTPELELRHLSLTYPNGHTALRDVNLKLGCGIVGLLGPNGAGKSSLMRILATLARPSAGEVIWRGHNTITTPDALRSSLGYLPQDFGIYPALSAREFLLFLATVKGLSKADARDRVDHCLSAVGLNDVANRPLAGYSGGMRQRVGIAQALLNDPALLIVDEPTVGLDPEERLRFRHLLTDLASNKLVLLSTHIVSDVEAIAQQLAVMSHGSLKFFSTGAEMQALAHGHVWQLMVDEESYTQLRQHYRVTQASRLDQGLLIRVIADERPLRQAQECAASLEDAYMYLLNHENN